MIDNNTPIIQDGSIFTDEAELREKRPRSWLCVVGFHRRTRWSVPFVRPPDQVSPFTSVMTLVRGGVLQTQARECLGCGQREERMV